MEHLLQQVVMVHFIFGIKMQNKESNNLKIVVLLLQQQLLIKQVNYMHMQQVMIGQKEHHFIMTIKIIIIFIFTLQQKQKQKVRKRNSKYIYN